MRNASEVSNRALVSRHIHTSPPTSRSGTYMKVVGQQVRYLRYSRYSRYSRDSRDSRCMQIEASDADAADKCA